MGGLDFGQLSKMIPDSGKGNVKINDDPEIYGFNITGFNYSSNSFANKTWDDYLPTKFGQDVNWLDGAIKNGGFFGFVTAIIGHVFTMFSYFINHFVFGAAE